MGAAAKRGHVMATKKTTKSASAKSKKPAAKKTAPASAATKKAAPKKSPVKRAASAKTAPAKKTTTPKPVTKKTVTKKSVTQKTAAAKSPATKKPAIAAKRTSVKNPATKKTTTTKKTATKKTTASKAATKKAPVKSAVKKPRATKTVKASPVQDPQTEIATDTAPEAETTSTPKATKKTATKKAATKKTTKKATRKKAVKEPAPKPVIVGKVGQAPRRTANEVAASNPFPVPPKLHEMQEETVDVPSPEAKAAKKEFKVNDQIVYPAHGVGVIEAIERQDIVGVTIEVFVIRFEHEKLTLRVPTEKAKAVGMRELSDVPYVNKTIDVLQGRARVKRTMWSRRAQEYEAKINSGNLNSVAEVVRDLYRAPEQPEQSYSERQLFEAALDRMSREVAAVKKIDLSAAVGELEASLQKKQIAAA